jgi:pyrroloquinoline quinone (PQQ) biosynthesis protein C
MSSKEGPSFQLLFEKSDIIAKIQVHPVHSHWTKTNLKKQILQSYYYYYYFFKSTLLRGLVTY